MYKVISFQELFENAHSINIKILYLVAMPKMKRKVASSAVHLKNINADTCFMSIH